MRKIFWLYIVLSISAVGGYSRIFYVPEEIPSLRTALKVVRVGDTISYDPGLIAEPVNWGIIQSKGIVLIYRRTPQYLPAMRSFSASVPDSGYWTGQARVTSPNSHYGSTSRIAIDSTGVPWVVWIGSVEGEPACLYIYYTKWEGNGWMQQEKISDPDYCFNFQPRITMDGSGNPWVIWMRRVNNVIHNIFYSRWTGSQWQPESQVNPPDSVTVGYGSVGYGGDRVWVSWERGIWGLWGDIWAVNWMGTHWSRPYRISEDDGIEDGIPFNMAVDQEGRAHFVWTRRTSEGLFPLHRFYDGDSLSPIFYLNEDGGGIQGDWPAVCVDTLGNVHVVWTGIMEYPPVNSYVFYRMFDGDSWTDPVVINCVDGLGNWRPSISALSPDDIWVVWDGVDSTGEYHIYAVHYDGNGWSDEMRLDSDITNDDGEPIVALDLTCNPWIVWNGYEVSTDTRQVFYNRYISTLSSEDKRNRNQSELVSIYPNPFRNRLYVTFGEGGDRDRRIEIFDMLGRKIYERKIKGSYAELSLSSFSTGVYFLRVKKRNYVYIKPLVKLRRR